MNRDMPKEEKKAGPLFWIPMIWNGFTLLIGLIVALTFIWGSLQPAGEEAALPGFILIVFWIFDLLMKISPLTLAAMVLISVFNVLKDGSKKQRFLPLTVSALTQGALSALYLSAITRPIS